MRRHTTESPSYDDLPEPVRATVLDLIFHPLPLDPTDFKDLARGRLALLCGPLAPKSLQDERTYQLGLLAAIEGRGC